MKKLVLGLGLALGLISVTAWADPSIGQYETTSNLSSTVDAGATIPHPWVEFTTFTLGSSAEQNINSTTYQGSSGDALDILVSNTSGVPIYMYVANSANTSTSFTAYQIPSSISSAPVPINQQVLPLSGSIYV